MRNTVKLSLTTLEPRMLSRGEDEGDIYGSLFSAEQSERERWLHYHLCCRVVPMTVTKAASATDKAFIVMHKPTIT